MGFSDVIKIFIVELQWRFFMSLVMVKFHVRILMTYCICLKYWFCDYFLGFSLNTQPIYGGLELIVSGEIACEIVINFGGSFFMFNVSKNLFWEVRYWSFLDM